MPDWSYRTLFRPMLFRMSPRVARTFTLGAMGAVSRLPGGRLLIKTLGHMEAVPALAGAIGSLPVRCPVGLGGRVDPEGLGLRALAQLGVGYIELGPVSLEPVPNALLRLDVPGEAIVYGSGVTVDASSEGAFRTARLLEAPRDVPYLVRVRPSAAGSAEAAQAEFEATAALVRGADGFFVDRPAAADWTALETVAYWQGALAALKRLAPGKPVLLYWPAAPVEPASERRLLEAAEGQGWDGYVVAGERMSADGLIVGRAAKEDVLAAIRRIRATAAAGRVVVAAGGMHEPIDAVQAREAGADLVQLDSGFVYAGPGLPKRMNEALLYERVRDEPPEPEPSYWRGWGWMCLLGIGMMLGGLIAWAIADTSVLLPYDERFLGATRAEIASWNPRLLHFMSHDRITLAGTMIAIGIFYYQLGRHGLRRGLHWAKTALLVSGAVGFSGFFLYLGYGYFDPLHAAVSALLLPMFLLAMTGHRDRLSRTPPNRKNDRIWRMAMWGQLCWVVMGFGFLAGGLAIAFVGVTNVFVPSDLAFLRSSSTELAALNDRLLPLIAHDRAGFGGALFSLACAMTASALWGIGQGERWLYLTFLAGGVPGFAAGLGVHVHIGYSDFLHLLPAYFQFALYVAGLVLLYPYMMRKPEDDIA